MESRAIAYAPESIRELGALLSCCDLVVCNDSGPMHLAAALDVPMVAIFRSHRSCGVASAERKRIYRAAGYAVLAV